MTSGEELEEMRERAPLVHNITNYVAMNVAANVLLAAGASPAMVHAEEEAADFARIAGALTINIGTLSAPWVASMEAAARAANDARVPWVLDPVAVGATAFRTQTAASLLEFAPTVVRGNASEILALAGLGGAGRGVDAGDTVAAAESAANALALRTGGVVAVTGSVDYVTDGETSVRIANGHAMMPRVTALGCALTCLVGAFLAGAPSPLRATSAALAYYGVAGERAAAKAEGPGTFATHFLDALAEIDGKALNAATRMADA
ncbi:MAG: hydroxyethylthiazole kinase [Pseudomonadota bacterium]